MNADFGEAVVVFLGGMGLFLTAVAGLGTRMLQLGGRRLRLTIAAQARHQATLAAIATGIGALVQSGRGISAILGGLTTSFEDEREQVVYEMAVTLANARWVSVGLYDRAVKALDHVGITDVITLMGHYSSVSMTLAFYDVPAGATGMAR